MKVNKFQNLNSFFVTTSTYFIRIKKQTFDTSFNLKRQIIEFKLKGVEFSQLEKLS